MNFNDLVKIAIERTPYPFQETLAQAATLPSMIRVPTGLGETADPIDTAGIHSRSIVEAARGLS